MLPADNVEKNGKRKKKWYQLYESMNLQNIDKCIAFAFVRMRKINVTTAQRKFYYYDYLKSINVFSHLFCFFLYLLD